MARRAAGADGATSLDVQSVYERIRAAIAEGRFRPGVRLVEQRLAEEFEVSRTPVREAIRLLEAEGLVVTSPNRGAMVRELSLDDVRDSYELRARLESYAAARAATRIGPQHIERIEQAVDRFDLGIRKFGRDPTAGIREVNRWNAEIHGVILEAAGDGALVSMVRRTADITLVFQSFRRFDRDRLVQSNVFHRLLWEACVRHDAGRAENLMREHINQGRDVLLDALAELPSVSSLFD